MSWIVNVSGDLAAPWMAKTSGPASTKLHASAGPRGNALLPLSHRRDPLLTPEGRFLQCAPVVNYRVTPGS